MRLEQFETDEGRRKDDPKDRPWRQHAPAVNKPPSNPNYPKKSFDYEEWMKSSQPKVEEDATEVPDIGDTIRTKKMQMEGVVTKLGQNRAGYDEVYFKVFDGRLMVTPLSNVTVIQKLADEENSMMEDRVDEVSTELLAKYKTAAGKSASEADKKGDYATGNKRFSGIVKATKKQFSNDAKKSSVSENSSVNLDIVWRKVEDVVSNIWPDGDPVDWLAPWAEKNGLDYSVFDDAAKKNGYNDVYEYYHSMGDLGEGSSGGINRSAPSNDVSYEKVLDEVNALWEREKLAELSVNTLRAYTDAAKSPEVVRHSPLRKVAKHVQGVQKASQRINVKTGNRTNDNQSARGMNEVDMNQFADLLGKQEQEKKAAEPKRKVTPIDFNGWTIKYRAASKPTDKVDWTIYNHKMVPVHKGESMSDKDAVNDAQEWIRAGAGSSKDFTGKATIDFNTKFTTQVGEGFFATIDTDGGKPVLIVSFEEQGGLKRSHRRNKEDDFTGEATNIFSIPMSGKECEAAGLVPNGRYLLGAKNDLGDGLWAFPLELHSVAQSKTDRFVLPGPGLTVGTERAY
jgi:hypothetical protein